MVRSWLVASIVFLSATSPALGAATDPAAASYQLMRQHRFQAAEQTLASVLQRDPDHLEANLQMGTLKQTCGDPKAGFGFIQRAASAHPESLEAQVMLVHAYLWLERYQDAEREATRTMAAWEGKNPDPTLWAKLLVGKGAALGLKVRKEGLWAAIKYGLSIRGMFERACELDAEGAVPLYALGRFYLEAPAVAGGDPHKGLELVRKAIRREPDSPTMRAFYIQYLTQSGRPDLARSELETYRQQFADVPGALTAIEPIAAKLP